MEKLQAMRQAALHVDHILLEKVPSWIVEGVTEQMFFDQLCSEIQAKGRYGLSFDPIVAFGAGGAEPHHEPTDTALKSGESILLDCGAVFDGWCSDCTRMFSLGLPSSSFQQKFTKLLTAHELVLPRFISGAKCSELDGDVRTFLQEDAPFFIHTLGHGVGAEVHTDPRIGKASSAVLQAGDVVTCEPGLYFPGEYGIRIEDQLLIRDGGAPEFFTNCPRELAIIDAWGKVTYQQ